MNNNDPSDIKLLKDSKSFDSVAISYDLYRPSYPNELVSIIQSVTGIPSSGRILEIGSGTGKATKLFAENGYYVHCIEPGINLVNVAKKRLEKYPKITYEITRFEEWKEKEQYYNLVTSAQAFHWIDPTIGYKKANKSLISRGYIALFWNMYIGFESGIDQEIEAIYKELVPELAQQRENTEELIKQREDAIKESGEFINISVHRVEWSKKYDIDNYIGLLSTYSDHICIPEKTRKELFDGIARVFQRNSGILNKPYLSVLYLGKRVE
jgi:SAM-dependent methyltransferase